MFALLTSSSLRSRTWQANADPHQCFLLCRRRRCRQRSPFDMGTRLDWTRRMEGCQVHQSCAGGRQHAGHIQEAWPDQRPWRVLDVQRVHLLRCVSDPPAILAAGQDVRSTRYGSLDEKYSSIDGSWKTNVAESRTSEELLSHRHNLLDDEHCSSG